MACFASEITGTVRSMRRRAAEDQARKRRMNACLILRPATQAVRIDSYLRTTGIRLGLVLNFNCRTLKEGITQIVV
jgi:hypothetical protein